MGREIRRVVPGWEHPTMPCPHSPWLGGCDHAKRNGGRCYHPQYDNDYSTACEEWYAGINDFKPTEYARWYHEDAGSPPEEEYYRSEKWTPEQATYYQIYETVSEGTPVTPPFATKAELVDYLVAHGDFWDQLRGKSGWSRGAAERFVESEWAPSMVATVNATGAEIKEPRDGI
jgi:hypothetical protein